MLDFLMISTRFPKKGIVEIYPKFIIPTKKSSSDLMVRGGDFYAIWNEDEHLWSTNEETALYLIDRELDKYAEEHKNDFEDARVKVLYMWDSDSGMIDRWHKYVQKQMRDCYHPLDETVIFANTDLTKSIYASKTLPYALKEGNIDAYNELMSVLYSPEERKKIEWAIGSVVAGESKYIQKFLVLYGAPGTGKSTVLNIIQKMFDGYCSVFDAKALGTPTNVFALEAFKTNPLVAIQHDTDLSKIEDNTRLNSIVSHELMTVNEKFKSAYTNRFNSFLFVGTNKPVKITDAKSGILRRLVDVSPTGNKIPTSKYKQIMNQINFELGGIAWHCKEVYMEDPGAYDDYIPTSMMGASNDFYNFILDHYDKYKRDDHTSLQDAWDDYCRYCDKARVPYPYSQRIFKEELKNYFKEFHERITLDDGTRVRSYYEGFLASKFESQEQTEDKETSWIIMRRGHSLLDDVCKDCLAQPANETGVPSKRWANVTTTLKDIDTTSLHYVLLPDNHIVIDFDIKNINGEKDFSLNLKEASKWPKTYAELSKSGAGIHLHYIYNGDPTELCRIYGDDIEIKVFTGNASLRRKLTSCNDIPIATIDSGLPLKGERKVIGGKTLKSERGLRKQILANLNKEIHPGTKPSVDFIYKILDDAYNSGLNYDVSDMRGAVLAFAANSTNHAEYCLNLVNKMKFKSEESSLNTEKYKDDALIFYDVEVFPNLFLVNWKFEGEGRKVVRMINPTSEEIEKLIKHRLVGFNCRRYDNHILYARMMGYTNEQLYRLSQNIITNGVGFFGEAYNLSYTDVYDFSSEKKSLKKFEIELGIHHQELGLPWDQPVPEELWNKVAEYCDNDVIATEAVFNARKGDWTARQILAKLADMTVNDTTNMLTTKIIFGLDRKPQTKFNYRDLGSMLDDEGVVIDDIPKELKCDPSFTLFSYGKPVFIGYKFENGVSTYRGEETGEGGYVYSEPGVYENVALLDIASMHPSSIIAENLFGPYTKNFQDLKDARLYIKHGDFAKAKKMLDGKLAQFLDDEHMAKDLAQALKIAINSVYGLTSAKFPNAFKDPRNVDNIVAKRGALFMINLKHEVQRRGFTVAHIKTDSIKIPNATKEIIQFVMDYGKLYGYNFEHEATYEKMCLVNDAVYIAKYADGEHEYKLPTGQKIMTPWTATGTQFMVPYVFKTLFAKEPIIFKDLCEDKSVSKGDIVIDMNETLPEGEHDYRFVGHVGLFCPIKKGAGGGVLYRKKDDKYYAVTGTKGYRWLESEEVKFLGKEDDIDISYYEKLADEAKATIETYGDFTKFTI